LNLSGLGIGHTKAKHCHTIKLARMTDVFAHR
jgi:hypothetical protein